MADTSNEAIPPEQRLRELEAEHRREASALRHELAVRYAELQAERDATAAFKRLVANAARELTTVDPVPALRRLASDGARQLAARSTLIRPRRRRRSSRLPSARVPGFQEAGLAQYVLDALAAVGPQRS